MSLLLCSTNIKKYVSSILWNSSFIVLRDTCSFKILNTQTGRLGIEPRFSTSKVGVLPLDDLPIFYSILRTFIVDTKMWFFDALRTPNLSQISCWSGNRTPIPSSKGRCPTVRRTSNIRRTIHQKA